LEVQETKLMDQVLTLFLYPYPSSIGSGLLGNQAWKFLFGCTVILVRNLELTL
jgi:hypothetical protein